MRLATCRKPSAGTRLGGRARAALPVVRHDLPRSCYVSQDSQSSQSRQSVKSVKPVSQGSQDSQSCQSRQSVKTVSQVSQSVSETAGGRARALPIVRHDLPRTPVVTSVMTVGQGSQASQVNQASQASQDSQLLRQSRQTVKPARQPVRRARALPVVRHDLPRVLKLRTTTSQKCEAVPRRARI